VNELPHGVWRIGDWRVRPDLGEISRNGRATKLDPRAMRLLMFLADRPGQIVGISELLDGVWGEAVVTPHSVYEAVAALRHALEDPSEKPTYIGTLPRRGYRLIAPVEPPPPRDRVSTASASAVEKAADDEAAAAAPHRRAAVALACAALGLAATFTIAWFTSTRHAPYAAAAVDKSIAVLPFLDMSEKQDQEYFADGMAQEVIDQLVRIPGLKVIGRASSFQFKGKSQDLRTVGSALGVNYVVEGSVRKSGDRLRVTAQLISAQDGSHVWSDTYDEPVGDALNVQDRIAANVVRALQFSVGATEYVAGRVAFKSPEAYELFLKGLHAHERWDKQGLEAAAAYWEKVLELDPTSVPAVEWLAWNHAVEATLVQRNPAEGFERARQLAQRALRLNPKSSLAYQCLAYVHYVYDWDWAAAERDARDAVRLSPSDSGAIGELGDIYRALGRWDESARLYETAISLDPLSSPWHARLRTLLLSTGRLREADAEARKALQISPTSNNGHYMLGSVLLAQGKPEAALAEMQRESGPWRDAGLAMVYYVMGRRAESDAALAKLIQEHGQDGAFVISRAYGYRVGLDQAFTWLERAYHQKDTWLWTIKLDQVDPLLKDFAHDSRFADFLRKMNLPEQ
jgi:TolB-like protein/DNA-binding winged helix-turn-helix (wHTH) protein